MDIYLMLLMFSISMIVSRIILYTNQKRKGGQVLIKIENPYKFGLIIFSLLVGGLTLMLVIKILTGNIVYEDVISDMFFISIAYYFLLPQIVKKKITENGILEFFSFLNFYEIKSIKWTKLNTRKKDVERLELIINKKKLRHNKVFIFVNKSQKKEINEILRKKI